AGAFGLALHLGPLPPDCLALTATHLELRLAGLGGPLQVDLTDGRSAYRARRGGRETIARAVGARRHPRVVDACAGLGRDAWVLARLGCRVDLLERSPVVAALLHDGLQRAAATPHGASVAAFLRLQHVDARTYLQALPAAQWPEVVYLDPMYPDPERGALPGKAQQALRQVVGTDPDAAELLELALERGRCRVVVKRPRRAPSLGGQSPSFSHNGRSTRFDVYLC
ncbi:MAG: class I SAM-dependent methyltransferase, partial [Candidatus Competibacterales bacterium]|nr:class I SAM-dependent methyltransferase [Candidatus Competibacterales bacterium]